MNENLNNSQESVEPLTPSQEIADLLISFGEEIGFDTETCEEISASPFEEAFETAYSYLTQAGLNADEILASFVEEPEEPIPLQ